LPGIDHIPAELIQACSGILCSETSNLIISFWNKKKWPDPLKKSIILPVYKKGDKTDCCNYRGTSLLSTLYEIVFNIFSSKSSPYVDEMIGDHQ
jgi:hypothetical protein